MQAIPLLRRPLRIGDVLLAAAVLAVLAAVIYNGLTDYRNNHGTTRDLDIFNSYLEKNVGKAGFGNPRVSLRDPVDTVCATHRGPDYRLCARIEADDGRIVSVYKLVPKPGGGSQRVKFTPGPAGSSSAAPRSTPAG